MQELPYSVMLQLNSKYESLSKIFQKYKLEIVRKGNAIPLDYVMVLPKRVNRNITKQVRQAIEKSEKSQVDETIRSRRQMVKSRGIELAPEDEKLITKGAIPDEQVQ